MKRIFKAIRPQAFGLRVEYHSDGGWKQFFPAEKKATVAYFTEVDDSDLRENVIIIEVGEEVEFTPTYRDFEKNRDYFDIEIR